MTMLFSVQRQRKKTKPALVLLHGWGAHSGVWQTVIPLLEKNFSVTLIDLPGHGKSACISENSIEAWAEAALDVAPEKAMWLGWSLGGLVAQQAAMIAPGRVEKLIMLASTPKFVASPDWTDAVDEQVFRDFHTAVIREPRASLLRFIALQTRGSETAMQDSRILRKTLLQPEPQAAALDAGMALLLRTDLREHLPKITLPVLLLVGERDTLIRPSLATTLATVLPDFEAVIVKQAGHAPFLSHPEACCQVVKDFYYDDGMLQVRDAT